MNISSDNRVARIFAQRPGKWVLNATATAICLVAAGCAGVQHMTGVTQVSVGNTDDGLKNLKAASSGAPTNAEYKADYLIERDRRAGEMLSQADAHRAAGQLQQARAAYERVLQLDAGNARAAKGLATLPQDARNDKLLTEGENFFEVGKLDLAMERATLVLEEHPQNLRAMRLREALLDAKAAKEAATAKDRAARTVLDAPVTLQYREASLRNVFETLSKATGMNILFDRDVKQDAKATIFVRDVSVSDAIDLILLQNQLEKRVINGNTLMIYPATSAKQADYQDLLIRSYQVTNADIKYLSTMLKAMLKIKEVAADERTGILVLRDSPETLRLAEKLIAVHDVPDPEIMLEVEVLEISSSRASNLGFVPPNSFSVTTPGTPATLTLGTLRKMTSNDLLATPLSLTLNFKLEDADAKILASPRIRARNKEKAKIMIGDRVPTITNSVTPLTTGSSVVTGNVTYQDVGLKLEFEPQVYSGDEVGIKIGLEVSNIAQQFTDAQGGRSYQIGTRNANTNLRLKDGETQILGGLISDADRNTTAKLPGLGHLPIIGRLFGNNDGTASRSEIILAITPRIVRNLATRAPEVRSIFSGTANVLRERPILADPVAQLTVAGTFGGSAAAVGSPAGAIRPAAAPPQGGTPAPLINPMPQSAGAQGQPSPPGQASPGSGLPPPPPMYVRPASAPR